MRAPLETAEITVGYINEPRAGKKWGNVKSTSGDVFWGPPALLSKFQKGETCKVEYEMTGNDGQLRALKQKFAIPQALQRPVSAPPRGRTDPKDSEQIFVVALLKEMIQPNDTTTDIIAKVNTLRDVYRNTFGASELQRDDQMMDEIPY